MHVPNEPDSDDVMGYELSIILARLFKFQHKHDELLTPIRCLHEIISLQLGLHIRMGIL